MSEDTKLSNLKGRRIRLLYTDDTHSKLNYGKVGTIEGVARELSDSDDNIAVLVRWDNGSHDTLITPGDLFAFVD